MLKFVDNLSVGFSGSFVFYVSLSVLVFYVEKIFFYFFIYRYFTNQILACFSICHKLLSKYFHVISLFIRD